MPALLPNFEYDIFISYRHKDNKYDGWVTEFVKTLRSELEATFKEDISIYFDENPHDGLQQHHEVDDSLRQKLKCLILIPIISQTYCDPKAFAWSNELIPFIQQAGQDSLGLKTRVGGGNIASRVLPVKIHDIDSSDRQLFEEVTGSVMRSIDFIYKESGVNRPLRSADDRSHNQQHTDYRNQVNKVANAIKEIIAGLRNQEGAPDEVKPSASTEPPRISYKPSPKVRWKPRIPRVPLFSLSLTTILLGIGFIGIIFLHLGETEVEIQTIRTIMPPPEGTRYYEFAGSNFELSPDGKLLAYIGTDSAGNHMLWVRPLNALVGKPLSGTEGAMLPFWSPDSRYVGFFANQRLKKIPASGGTAQILCEATDLGRGGTWNREGTIVFNRDIGGPLYRVSASGGPPIRVTTLDSAMNHRSHRYPYFLPDGKHFLYMARTAVASIGLKDALYVGSLDTTFVPKLIVPIESSFAYTNGQLVYLQGETLMAQSFDSRSFRLEEEAKPVAEDVGYTRVSGKASFSVSQNGLLAYQEGYFNDEKRPVLRDRKGKKLTAFDRVENYGAFRISPDEKKIALAFGDSRGTVGDTDIWLYEIDRSIWTRFSFDAATPQQWPIWSPDGSTLMYSSLSSGVYDLFQRPSDGSSAEKIVYKSGERKIAFDWSPDGRFVIYGVQLHGQSDLWILPMDDKQPGKPYPFLATPFDESEAEFSPDGRWVAYNSNESGPPEVYIRPFPGPGGKRQVSTEGGSVPRWSKDGKEIFYISLPDPNIIMVSEVKSTASTLELGTARKLLEFNSVGQGEVFDVAQNGDRFLFIESKNEFVLRPVTLVANWPEELKKK